jgi:cell division protein FtsZ
MEKRSSMKESGLSSLFRATEAAKPAEEGPKIGAPVEPEPMREPQPAAAGGVETPPAGGREASADSLWTTRATSDAARRTLIPPSRSFPAVIRVIGVGGAGVNAINRMLEAGLEGVEFIAIETDAQALATCEADHKLRIGSDLTKGLGGGSDPKVGRDAALAAYDEIKSMLRGSDMVFITAGEGGGTGTGAAPVVAEIARSLGALTIGVVSRPFAFEGKRRGLQALEGSRLLKQRADTVIVVPNDKLLTVADRHTTMVEALRLADDVLRQGVQGICDLVTVPGLINLDLADVRTIMSGAGTAHMGIGRAHGEGRGRRAAEMALNSSLLETSIEGARGILLNISGGKEMSLHEVTEVAETVNAAAEREANIIFGAVVDESLGDTIWVTVVATGFDATSEEVLTAQVEEATRHDHVATHETPAAPAAAPATEPPREKPREAPAETSRVEWTERTVFQPRDDELDVPPFLR